MSNYKVKSLDLVEKVHSMIKLMILKNQLVPGQKLVQEDLAKKLGVSRTPLLAALSKLEKEFLVESRPRRGYYIRKLSSKEELDLFDIRIRLEPLAAYHAANHITDKSARDINNKAFLSSKEMDSMNHQAFCEYDFQFHKTIQEMSDNEFLYKMISSYNLISLSNQQPLTTFLASVECHIALAEAIAEGRAEEAEKQMYEHILSGRNRIINQGGER